MEEMLPHIVEYGVLGLWTVSLLWARRNDEARHQAQLDKMEERHVAQMKDAMDVREKLHSEIVDELKEVSRDVDTALNKLDEGLTAMREKYAEDRLRERPEREKGNGS